MTVVRRIFLKAKARQKPCIMYLIRTKLGGGEQIWQQQCLNQSFKYCKKYISKGKQPYEISLICDKHGVI